MFQPDNRFKPESYPPGGVAPTSHDLARYYYIQRIKALRRRR